MAHDFTTDPNPRYLYFAELHQPFPDWVAHAPITTPGEIEKKANTAFADTARRLLPIHDKVATFHSAINLFAAIEDFDETIAGRVKCACDFFEISDLVAPYAGIFADQIEKSASAEQPQGRFAIDSEINGQRYQILPLNDAYDVGESGADLAKMATDRRIHFINFVEAARNVVKAASDFGVTGLPEIVLRVGAVRVPDMAKAARLLEGRAHCAKLADPVAVQAAYDEALKESDPDVVMYKIAAIDSAAGISHKLHPGAALPLPSDIVFGGPLLAEIEKVARENAAIGDVLIPLAELQKINRAEVEFKLSKQAGEAFLKVLDTDDATDISLVAEGWVDADRKTLLRLASQI